MRHYYETITATLDTCVHFDFEALLRKHFGLKGEYHTQEWKDASAIVDEKERDEAFSAILDKNGLDGYFTKEAWDAWERALDFLKDLEEAGIINSDIYNHISERFCDNA